MQANHEGGLTERARNRLRCRRISAFPCRNHPGDRHSYQTMPFTISEATAAEEAGFNTRKVRFDPKSPVSAIAVHNAAPSTFTTFCTGLRKVATVDEAVRAGYDAMEAGADGVLCQWGPDFIRAVRGGGYCRRMTARLAHHRSFTRGLCCKALLRQLI